MWFKFQYAGRGVTHSSLRTGDPSGREKREKEGKRSRTLEPKGPPTVLEMFCALKNILNVQNVNLCGPWVLGT